MAPPASRYASGAARPSRRTTWTPVTDMARVGAMPPIDSAAVAQNPRSLCSVRPLPVPPERRKITLTGPPEHAELTRPGHGLLAAAHPELGVDVAGVGLDRVQRHVQLVADLAQGQL